MERITYRHIRFQYYKGIVKVYNLISLSIYSIYLA